MVLQIWIAGQNIVLKLANGRTILVLLKIVEEPPLSMRTRSGVSFIINGPNIASVLNVLMNCFKHLSKISPKVAVVQMLFSLTFFIIVCAKVLHKITG